ncbi:hypothetical protein [Ornithinimicrobium pekingense]|uniref:hypothetical protein n=1 Tax=Ornithinimicrobium pekingense TaxID=384677 RepID=UPI0003B5E4D0|nr:hypothetical protein [Ornithinimicrobium pekingense]
MNPHRRAVDLGLGDEAQVLYRHVLRNLPRTPEQHAEALGWPADRTTRLLRDLERLGLVRHTADGTVRVDDPRATVGRLLDGEEVELDGRRRRLLELREALETFEHDYRRGLQLSGPRTPPWDRVAPTEASAAVDHLLRTTTGGLLQVSRYVSYGPGHEEEVQRQRDRWLSSGRSLRSVFPQSVLESEHWSDWARGRAADGEEQRYLPVDAIPVAFGVFGSSAVVLSTGHQEDFLIVRDTSLVEVFTALFEELWRRAEPALGRDVSDGEVRLLELLALGLKDEAVARQLGLSLRTVRRRIATLMAEHGADTRYQLGLAAGRLGLLDGARR